MRYYYNYFIIKMKKIIKIQYYQGETKYKEATTSI